MSIKTRPGLRHRASISLGALAWAILWIEVVIAMQTPENYVIIHHRGKKIELSTDVPQVLKLVFECEEQLRRADNILRLAVSKQLIRSIQKNELAVEITYEEPKSIIISIFNDRTVMLRRLLIPLTGDLAGNITTIFLGDPTYKSGPYRNSTGTGELLKIIESLGIDPTGE